MERAEKQGLGLVLVHTKKGKPREREGGGGVGCLYPTFKWNKTPGHLFHHHIE
jgi:hypothetical protein